MFPEADRIELHGCQCLWHVFLQCGECVITVVAKIFLHGAPEKFNKIKLTMKFGQKNAQMSCGFNDFLNEGFLGTEIWLLLKDALIATVILVTVTFVLTFPAKPNVEYTPLAEDGLDSFWLVREFRVIGWEDHGLRDFLAISHIPSVVHASLFSGWSDIHSRHK